MGNLLNEAAAKAAIGLEGVGGAQAKSEEKLFVENCLNWLRTWIKLNGALANQRMCVFLYCESRMADSLLPNEPRLRRGFKVAYSADAPGNAYACSVELGQVYGVELPSGVNDFPTLADWMVPQGISDCVVVAFIPNQKATIIAFPGGEPARIDLAPSGGASFSFNMLDDLLMVFYEHAVKTHLGGCKIWQDHKKRVLRLLPEKTVQGALYLFLLGNIELHDSGTVRVEVDNPEGREDVEITVSNNGVYQIGVIELKVLKPQDADAKNLNWALQGIQQVIDYCKARQHVAAKFVCCYDGRKADTLLPEFFSKAKAESIEGRRYFMGTPSVPRIHDTVIG